MELSMEKDDSSLSGMDDTTRHDMQTRGHNQRPDQKLMEMQAEGELCILRVKNRFEEPTPGGWADIMINACFPDDEKLHIFELQFVHTKMSVMRKEIGGHHDYKMTRAASEIVQLVAYNSKGELVATESEVATLTAEHYF